MQVFDLVKLLPGDFRSNDTFLVTSGHLRSRDAISCHVIAPSCELQPCRWWNTQYTRVFGLLQPLPGDFRSNDVTPVNSGHL